MSATDRAMTRLLAASVIGVIAGVLFVAAGFGLFGLRDGPAFTSYATLVSLVVTAVVLLFVMRKPRVGPHRPRDREQGP